VKGEVRVGNELSFRPSSHVIMARLPGSLVSLAGLFETTFYEPLPK
jgi:hypothetical protein